MESTPKTQDSLTSSGSEKRSLIRKLSEVMALVSHIPKTGHNNFHGYDYATEADITAAVRVEMAKRQLMLIPSVVDSKSEIIGDKKNRLVTIRVRYTLEDGESGETRQFDMLGEGSDSLDKAFYKAMTGATKYAVLKAFLIPTGDDPEKDEKPGKSLPKPSGTEGLANKAKASPRVGPVADSPEARGEPALHDRSLVLAFNNDETLPVHSLTVEKLRWFQTTISKNIDDPKKSQFREANVKAHGIVSNELIYRGVK